MRRTRLAGAAAAAVGAAGGACGAADSSVIGGTGCMRAAIIPRTPNSPGTARAARVMTPLDPQPAPFLATVRDALKASRRWVKEQVPFVRRRNWRKLQQRYAE